VCEGEWLSENDAMHNEIVHNESEDFFWRDRVNRVSEWRRASEVEPGLGADTRRIDEAMRFF
jgi:hypothetical protein